MNVSTEPDNHLDTTHQRVKRLSEIPAQSDLSRTRFSIQGQHVLLPAGCTANHTATEADDDVDETGGGAGGLVLHCSNAGLTTVPRDIPIETYALYVCVVCVCGVCVCVCVCVCV